ncbi:MAG TPA: glycosyltransferase [Acidimicrobiales bacterium]|nr:glycosyltransferase [Acidimicrobiales bacterium]
MTAAFDVVIPTVGRGTLGPLVETLVRSLPASAQLIVVDDRPAGAGGAVLDVRDPRVRLVRSGGRGPAAARNAGWRAATKPWVAFVDDDVDLPIGWVRQLEDDLRGAGDDVGAVQGRIEVPVPARRRPSDWERNVGALAHAPWITADLAVRREALVAVGGFDERFRRAYREDTDLTLRLLDVGWRLVRGGRHARHPVRPAPWWISVRSQRGNGDDVLLERLHGRDWRRRLNVAPGTFASHRVTLGAALGSLVGMVTGRRRAAAVAAAWWAARTARFAWGRIAPGPRTPREVAAMIATSVAVPPAACYHRVRGAWRWRATSL